MFEQFSTFIYCKWHTRVCLALRVWELGEVGTWGRETYTWYVIHASRTVDSPETEARASERGRAVSGMNETKTRRIRHERAAEAQPRTQKTVTRERRAFGSIFTFSRRADKGLERGVGAAGSAASAGSLNPKQSNYRTVYIRYSHYICRIDSEQHVRISSAQCPLVL